MLPAEKNNVGNSVLIILFYQLFTGYIPQLQTGISLFFKMNVLLTTKSVPFFFASTSGEHRTSGLPYWNCKWYRFSTQEPCLIDNKVRKMDTEYTAIAAASASR
jgi:hypothetical protein